MEIPVYYLSALAEGRAAPYNVPSDFLERVRTYEGAVGLGSGWEALHAAFDDCACYVPADGSDYLYLDDDNETDALERLAWLAQNGSDEIRPGVPDAIEAIQCMAAQRQGLGLDAVQWILG